MPNSGEEFRRTLRIIDASLNRIGEGLRFLEETALMILNDSSVTQELKTLRHTTVITGDSFQRTLEEIAEIPGAPEEMDMDRYRQGRFTIYTLERKLFSMLLRRKTAGG